MSGGLYDVAVIGGGIVGLASAYQVLRQSPGRRVVVLEKDSAVGRHQSSHNSGVLHAGVYYPRGSLKARYCVRGKRLLERDADLRESVANVSQVLTVDKDDLIEHAGQLRAATLEALASGLRLVLEL